MLHRRSADVPARPAHHGGALRRGPMGRSPTTPCRNPSDYATPALPGKLRSPSSIPLPAAIILLNAPPEVKKLRVLVVDDNVDAANTLAELLAVYECTANVAYSGLEALVLGEVIRPDLILLDISMPTMNGFETAGKIRAQPWGERVRIVALTAWGDDHSRNSTLRAGMDFHLTKPVGIEVLLGILALSQP